MDSKAGAALKGRSSTESLVSAPRVAQSRTDSACGKHVEMLWDVQVDRVSRGRYVCRVSRTAGSALIGFTPKKANPSRPEGAPLRRKAIRSLTTRLNVPVVRERIRA